MRTRILGGVVILAVAGFLAGLGHLFGLRLEGGDIYPVYSSYRADPLGTRLFHDALADLPQVSVRRNTRSIDRIEVDRQTVVLMLGLNDRLVESPVAARRIARFESLLAAGARVVMTVSRESRDWFDMEDLPDTPPPDEGGEGADARREDGDGADTEKEGRDGEGDDEEVEDGLAGVGERRVLSGARWGFEVDRLPFGPGEEPTDAAPLADPTPAAPAAVPLVWFNSLRFTAVEEPWTILYRRGGEPVMMERPYLRGSLVLATDSYFVSNEGLLEEPHPALLAALVGDRTKIVFEETVHGGTERPGIITLVRRYRLHGFAAGGLLLLALFLWRARSGPFASGRSEPEDEDDVLVGRESRVALVSLLRRSLSPNAALQACIAEWRAVFGEGDAELSRAFEALRKGSTNPVEGYRTIRNLIAKQKGRYVT